MPAAHPITALRSLGGTYRAEAERRIISAIVAHGGNIRRAAEALEPPVLDVTLHGWLSAWGLRDAVRDALRKAGEEEKSERAGGRA